MAILSYIFLCGSFNYLKYRFNYAKVEPALGGYISKIQSNKIDDYDRICFRIEMFYIVSMYGLIN